MGKGKGFTRLQTDDPQLNRLQDHLGEVLKPLLANPAAQMADWRFSETAPTAAVPDRQLQLQYRAVGTKSNPLGTWTTVFTAPYALATWVTGQFLTRNAAGTLSWATPAGSGGGLPANGTLGQSVVNTAAGTGVWDWPQVNPVFGRRVMAWQAQDGAPGAPDWTSTGAGIGIGPMTASSSGISSSFVATLSDRYCFHQQILGAGSFVLYYYLSATRPKYRPRTRTLIVTPASIAAHRIGSDIGATAVGGLQATPPVIASVASALRHVRWVYDVSVSPNWILESADGANRSGINSGIAVLASTYYWFDLDWSVLGTLTCRIYTGSPTAAPSVITKNTNLPTIDEVYFVDAYIANTGAGLITGPDFTTFMLDQN